MARRLIALALFEGRRRTSFVRSIEATFHEATGRGWSCELVLPATASSADWAQDIAASGAEVHTAPRDGLREWVTELAGSSGEPTVLHSHFTGYDMAAARAAHDLPGVRAIWHFHTILSRSPRMVARHVAKLQMARRLDVAAIICPSPAMCRALIRRGAPRRKVQPFNSAIDLEAFPALDDAERATARGRLGVPGEGAVLLHFGWDWKVKGGDRFLDAVRALLDTGIEVTGLARAGPEAQEKIDAAGLQESVRVLGPSEPSDMYGAADVLMATSRGEGLPFAVLESLASGTPVVATDIPGHRMVEGAPLCTITSADPADLARAVRDDVQARRAHDEALRAETRRWVAERFSLDAYAAKMTDLYEEVLTN